MVDDMDGDVFETKLIKNAVAPFNDSSCRSSKC